MLIIFYIFFYPKYKEKIQINKEKIEENIKLQNNIDEK